MSAALALALVLYSSIVGFIVGATAMLVNWRRPARCDFTVKAPVRGCHCRHCRRTRRWRTHHVPAPPSPLANGGVWPFVLTLDGKPLAAERRPFTEADAELWTKFAGFHPEETP